MIGEIQHCHHIAPNKLAKVERALQSQAGPAIRHTFTQHVHVISAIALILCAAGPPCVASCLAAEGNGFHIFIMDGCVYRCSV